MEVGDLIDDAALAVLGQVIADNPAFRGKWSATAPPIASEPDRSE